PIRGRGDSGTLFSDAAAEGIYQLVASNGDRRPRAVNLADLAESDLENAAPLKLQASAPETGTASSLLRAPLASYLLAAMLLLGALEAVAAYRRRRVMVAS